MRAFVIILLASLLAVVLQVLGTLHPGPSNWGVHHYAYLPGGWLAAGALAGLVVFLLGWSGGPGVNRIRIPAAPLAGLVAVAGGALFWGLRERAYFMGDGALWIEGLKRGRLVWHDEPASLAGVAALNRAVGSPDPGVTFALVSVVCGVIFLVLALVFARLVTDRPWARTLIFGLAVLSGYTRLFYGYVETYPILAVLVLAYLVALTAWLRGRGALWPAVLLASVAPVFHVTAVFLLPSLAYALWVGPVRGEAGTGPSRGARLLALLAPAVVLVAGVAAMGLRPGTLSTIYADYLGKFLPLGGPLEHRVPYSLLSAAHLSDFFQEQMLLGPFGAPLALALLVFGARGRLGREGGLLLWAGLPWWAFSFLFNREIGAARDWDLFSVAAIPLVLATAVMLARVDWGASRPRLAGAATGLLLGASVFHTLPWVSLDAEPERAMTHFAGLYGPGSGASPFARSYAFEEIASWYLERGEAESALAAYRESALADTLNVRSAGNEASMLINLGRPEEALEALAPAVARKPGNEVLRLHRGNAYRDLRRLDDAGAEYEKALELNPDFLQAYLGLAYIQRQLGNLAQAESTLVRAQARFPEDADVKSGLALVREAQGDPASAAAAYREALARNPRDGTAAFNLGLLLLKLEKPAEAESVLTRATRIDPGDFEAWINLGVSRDLQKKHEQAEAAFRKAMAVDPKRPEPYFNLGRGYLARGDTTRAVEVLREYAAVDSTSRMGTLALRLLSAMGAR